MHNGIRNSETSLNHSVEKKIGYINKSQLFNIIAKRFLNMFTFVSYK